MRISDWSSDVGSSDLSEEALKIHNLTPKARIAHFSVTAGDPVMMLEEPIPATERVLKRAGLKIGDIDLYEVNEARSEEHTSELQSLMRNSYAVFCLKQK